MFGDLVVAPIGLRRFLGVSSEVYRVHAWRRHVGRVTNR